MIIYQYVREFVRRATRYANFRVTVDPLGGQRWEQ